MKTFTFFALLFCLFTLAVVDAKKCRKGIIRKFQTCLARGFESSIEGCVGADAVLKRKRQIRKCSRFEQILKRCGYSCPIDGGWTEFGNWSECSESCGDGTQTRTRTCTNPAPAHGGAACEGEESESQACSISGCCNENTCYKGDTGFTALKLDSVLNSLNGEYAFRMQNDGNLVLYCKGNAVWSSDTSGETVSGGLKFQADGNLVLYDTASTPLWHSNSHGTAASRMVLQNDGNLVLYSNAGEAVWSTGTAGQCDCSDNACYKAEQGYIALELGSRLTSPNGDYTLRMQTNGDLVLYCKENALWSSKTANAGVAKGLKFQTDGNLVLYDADSKSLWHSNSHGTAASVMVLQDDGNFVLYNNAGESVWATQTAGQC